MAILEQSWQHCLATVWKFHHFSINQILREINFNVSTRSKTAIFAFLEGLNFDFHDFLHFLKARISKIRTIQTPQNGTNGSFRIPRFFNMDFT